MILPRAKEQHRHLNKNLKTSRMVGMNSAVGFALQMFNQNPSHHHHHRRHQPPHRHHHRFHNHHLKHLHVDVRD